MTTQRSVDRWITLMKDQAGFDATLSGRDITLAPQLTLQSDTGCDDPSVGIQLAGEGKYTLTLVAPSCGDRHWACKCRDSLSGATYVEHAEPDAPLRVPVAPGDVVRVKLEVDYSTRRGVPKHETLLSGTFVVPQDVHKMGAPGYNVNVPHLGTQMYFCAGNVGSPPRLELLTFHITLLL